MKRIFGAKTRLLISVLALACILAVGGTMAFLFASTGVLTNTFAVAQLDTVIDDTGTGVNKTVTITNNGDSPAWVRARLLVSGIDPKNVVIVSEAPAAPTDGKLYLVMPNTDEDQWSITPGENAYSDLMNGEGWIYYTRALNGKTDTTTDKTDELLQGVRFGAGLDPNSITITITHESVLALGNSYADAFNTPAG